MDKVQVPLVLVENIGDHLLFAVVHQVVTLTALQQEGLQPVIGGFPAARPIGKARHRVLLRPDLVDKVLLVAHVHQQVEVAKVLPLFRRQALQFHRGAAQPQLLGHFLHRRVAHRLHHLFGIACARVIHQPRQALLPAQPVLQAHRARGGVAAGADPAVIFHFQGFIQSGHHEENHKAERQPHDHRGVLQRRDAVGH